MRIKSLVPAFALAGLLGAPAAQAVVQLPASASIDWSTLQINLIDTDANDDITPSLTFLSGDFDTRYTVVGAQEDFHVFDYSPNWTDGLTISEGGSHASADADLLQAWFSGVPPPHTFYSYSQSGRGGQFIVSANTLVTFQVGASVAIDLPVPLNGGAYASSRLETSGPGFSGDTENEQRTGTDRYVWANGLGSLQESSGTLYASFYNGTLEDMQGNVNGTALVYSYGFIPVVPEPATYGMMLAGLGLLVAVSRRRRG